MLDFDTKNKYFRVGLEKKKSWKTFTKAPTTTNMLYQHKHDQKHLGDGSYKDAIAALTPKLLGKPVSSLPASVWESCELKTLLLGSTDPRSPLSRLGWMLIPLLVNPLRLQTSVSLTDP